MKSTRKKNGLNRNEINPFSRVEWETPWRRPPFFSSSSTQRIELNTIHHIFFLGHILYAALCLSFSPSSSVSLCAAAVEEDCVVYHRRRPEVARRQRHLADGASFFQLPRPVVLFSRKSIPHIQYLSLFLSLRCRCRFFRRFSKALQDASTSRGFFLRLFQLNELPQSTEILIWIVASIFFNKVLFSKFGLTW